MLPRKTQIGKDLFGSLSGALGGLMVCPGRTQGRSFRHENGLLFLPRYPVHDTRAWMAICLIMAFSARNLNKRHYARAQFIALIFGILFIAAGYIVFTWTWEVLIDIVQGTAGEALENLNIFNIFKNMTKGGLLK
ncbi:MAG: hypothetical protein LBS19_04960 [Clostridiales bacterium]|jgi:hypothetical protein|nr:hypothetical protein [Clostridiales bacterium]